MSAQVRIIFLYPNLTVRRVDRRTANEAGIIAHSIMTELVSDVIYVPRCLRYEKK